MNQRGEDVPTARSHYTVGMNLLDTFRENLDMPVEDGETVIALAQAEFLAGLLCLGLASAGPGGGAPRHEIPVPA